MRTNSLRISLRDFVAAWSCFFYYFLIGKITVRVACCLFDCSTNAVICSVLVLLVFCLFLVFLRKFRVGLFVVAAVGAVFPLWNKRRWEQCEGQKCEVYDLSGRPLFSKLVTPFFPKVMNEAKGVRF